MPIYEYECDKCGLRFEKRQSINEDPISVCPQTPCGGATRRLIHPVGIVFKTGGFYITDNRPKSTEDSASKSTISTSTSASTSTSTSTTTSTTTEVTPAKKD